MRARATLCLRAMNARTRCLRASRAGTRYLSRTLRQNGLFAGESRQNALPVFIAHVAPERALLAASACSHALAPSLLRACLESHLSDSNSSLAPQQFFSPLASLACR